MYLISTRNVHNALPEAMSVLMNNTYAIESESRNGPVRKAKYPVTTMYLRPDERVLFWPERNANPYFHFMESLWMLAGRNDVKWISQFNKSFGQFSDDGKRFHGAYGHRWRMHFKMDQIKSVVEILRKNLLDRRAVIQMWSADDDLGRDGLDFPCNLIIAFDATDGRLNMTVFNRSNDIVWGAYGANAVHMSFLQEFVASAASLPLGIYWQVSNNWHGYLSTIEKVKPLIDKKFEMSPYDLNEVKPFPIMTTPMNDWLEDLDVFMDDGPIVGFRDVFFRRVVTPIYHSWMAKNNTDDPNRYEKASEIIQQCSASDWRKACQEWLDRNIKD